MYTAKKPNTVHAFPFILFIIIGGITIVNAKLVQLKTFPIED
jgi:hypothetical protein